MGNRKIIYADELINEVLTYIDSSGNKEEIPEIDPNYGFRNKIDVKIIKDAINKLQKEIS